MSLSDSLYYNRIKEEIFNIKDREQFKNLALEIFNFQARHCLPYSEFISLLGINYQDISSIEKVPFLPVSLFKSRKIISREDKHEAIFTSSATTGVVPAKHYIVDLNLYIQSFTNAFRLFLGEPSHFTILALLPSYLEREGSSLIYMVERLIKDSGKDGSGFYLYNHEELFFKLKELKERGERTILIGVSFALLDFVQSHQIQFPELIVIETGGMKGRGREISRDELHLVLKEGFGIETVWSEYGMAELLSQAWSTGNGIFRTPPWMDILIRDLSNPFKPARKGYRGGINIIDLANINSCSFIETQDMGIEESKDSFRVLGRIESSELRGCNILLDK